MSFLLGIPVGAALGGLSPEEARIIAVLAVSVPIGILAGILGGIWTDVREARKVGNS